MKKSILISATLLALGFIFECLYFMTDINFLQIKLNILGIICIVLGVGGLLWFVVIPLLENRAKVVGKFKKENLKNK